MADSLSGTGTLREDSDPTDDTDETVLKGGLDLEAMGLTKEDLRRLLLASYVTQATTDTELGIEITYEELQEKLSQSELNFLRLTNETPPDEAGYYYVRVEDEETGEVKYFTATRGNIRIENEDEDELICVNNATFDYYLDWFNGDANQEVGANTVKKMYTVKEIGKIEMITYTRTGNTYEFSTKTLDYAHDTEIEQCMIQLELLVDFLQFSASPDFLEAFERLIIDQDITLRVFSMATLETTQTERTYPIDITVDARKTMTFQGRRSGSSYAASSGDVDTVTTYRDVTYEIPRFELQRSTSTETENVDFELKLISADSWYFTADREVTKSTVTSYAYYDESGASTAFTPENPDDPLAGAPEYAVPGFSFDVTSLEELENRLRQEIGSNDINIDTQKSIINGKLQDRSDVQDLIDYYTDNNEYAADSGSGYSNYELIEYSAGITNINVTSENGTEKKVKKTERDILNTGTMNYEDNTDAFLGLWKNDSGNYEEGASFNPDGQKVKYKDIYEKDVETAIVGDLFAGADQMFFELLDYSENTQAYIPVMKYILYRYTGDDYGVTTFEDLMRLMGLNTRDVSNFPGGSVQEQVWWALINAGYSKIAAAAVLGNIECESGFDPTRIEDGTGDGLGLCQWSFGRRTQFEAYIASKGTDTSDIGTQIEFLLGELTPGGGANGYATYQLGGSSSSAYDGNSYTASDWENATDLDIATTAFMALFERPSYDPDKHHLSDRKEAAHRYYNQFKDMEQPTSDSRIGPINLTGDNAIKMAAMLTEALRIADDDRYYYSQDERYGEWSYDCSSFAYRLYQEYFGITIGTWTGDIAGYTAMAVYESTDMSESNLEPGDVLWCSGHVALYLGNGQYVHASSPENGIMVSTYTQGYFTKLYRYVE